MTDCSSLSLQFPACRKRRVEADFSGGDITSNGGVLRLRQADRLSGLTASVAPRASDARRKGKAEHRFAAMLRQRALVLALGHEDVNGHADLRHDLAFQTAAEGTGPWPAHRRRAASRTPPGDPGRARRRLWVLTLGGGGLDAAQTGHRVRHAHTCARKTVDAFAAAARRHARAAAARQGT